MRPSSSNSEIPLHPRKAEDKQVKNDNSHNRRTSPSNNFNQATTVRKDRNTGGDDIRNGGANVKEQQQLQQPQYTSQGIQKNDNRDETPEDEHKAAEQRNASAEAGGVIRGAARSVGRSVLKSPVGRLPREAILRRPLPLRQVARISDRLSTGFEWWSSAQETTATTTMTKTRTKETKTRFFPFLQTKDWLPKMRAFTVNLLKNTILGVAVFETYGFVILSFAPCTECKLSCSEGVSGKSRMIHENEHENENDYGTEAALILEDEYSRASISLHLVAGFAAGSMHGIATTLMEMTRPTMKLRSLLLQNITHHACAHSLLFGAYEGLKRLFVAQMHEIDDGTKYLGAGYLISFGVAGGFAGQVQHLGSHYLEQCCKTSNSSNVTVPPTSFSPDPPNLRVRQPGLFQFVAKVRRKLVSASPPALRPTLAAFLPSAVGFVAFEYGKKFTA